MVTSKPVEIITIILMWQLWYSRRGYPESPNSQKNKNLSVQVIAAGRSKSQAYRESYDARGMSEQSIWCEAHRLSVHPKVAPRLVEIQSECSERLVSSAIADREEVLVAVTDILRSDDSSNNAKLKSAEIPGK